MIKVGITGGIGSGKTIISRLFAMMGIPVFNADYEAKSLVAANNTIRLQLISVFGTDIYLPNHTINRKKFASIIFNNEFLLKQANEIIHPVVQASFHGWSEKQVAPFVLYEAAILFESGHYREMNYNILVLAEGKVRIRRVMQRDQSSEEQVRRRMANQWADEKKIELTNFIINNNERDMVIPQVLEIYKKINTDG